jgi:hypothetical protein
MKEFNLKDLLENNTAVSCKTKKQAKELFKELQILGYIWKGGEKLSAKNTYYSTYKEETCYTIDNMQGIIAYQDITYFKENGYKIIQIKDIIIKKQTN